jgi:DNA-binding CsgD family transcriptional regulator
MTRLRSQDYRDIINLTHVAQLEPDVMRHNMLPRIAKAFRVERAIFFFAYSDLKRIDPANLVTLNIDEAATSKYVQYYWRLDPVYRAASYKRDPVFTTDDILPRTRWFKLKYYTEFQRPQDIREELLICLRYGANLLGMVDLIRSKEEPDFDYRDILKAKIVAPCITATLHNAFLFSKIEQEKSTLADLLEHSSKGILILDYDLRPLYCNSKGKQVCFSLSNERPDQTKGVCSGDLPIPFEIAKSCLDLKALQKSGRHFALAHHTGTTIVRHNERFRIESFLIQDTSRTPSTASFAVYLENPYETTHKRVEGIIDEDHHLTKREMEIIQCVCEGLTNSQIAEKLFISRVTVETHMRNIFEKMGVQNRTELVAHIKFPWIFSGNRKE